jgi:2-polyprenyl-6-methoxyphenol hydroxylase-like FAD-dependent oxidoreductase
MFGKHETDVLVVGAGPVGLFTALALVERGVRVEVIDEQWRTTGRSYALALHARSLDLLERFGIAGKLSEIGHRVESIAFYDGAHRRARISLAELSPEYPYVLVLSQEALENSLEESLRKKRVRVQWNHRLKELHPEKGHVRAEIERLGKFSEGYSVATMEWVVEKALQRRAAFVVGADGYGSAVRRALGVPFEEKGPPQIFAVFEFESDAKVGNEVRVVLDGGTTSVLWPLRDGRFRWSFELPDPGDLEASRAKSRIAVQIAGQAYPHLGVDQVRDLIAEHAPWFQHPVHDLVWSMAVRFERRLARGFGRGTVWLVGDAGHLTGPVGVQSMNVGLREAHDLASRIAGVMKENAPLDTLEEYGRERMEEWEGLLGAGVEARPDAPGWVQDRAKRILSCLPASGEDLNGLLEQVGLERK